MFDYFKNNKKLISIEIPYVDYIRGNVFIDDLRDNFHETPYRFDVPQLMYLLYDDFLNQIKKGADNKEIAQFLIRGKQQYFNKKVIEKRVMKQVTSNFFQFENGQEVIEGQNEKEKKVCLELKIRENVLLRGEILLHDIDDYMKDEHVTIEEIFAIRYLDFIRNVKQKGNSVQVQRSILERIVR